MRTRQGASEHLHRPGRCHQDWVTGAPSVKPARLWIPTTALAWNSSRLRAPAYVHELRTPATIWSMTSSTLGRAGSMYIRAEEMPSSKTALRARSYAVSLAVRLRTARDEAMPKDSLYCRPSLPVNRSPGDSRVPANHDPIMTLDAPAASASATSRG